MARQRPSISVCSLTNVPPARVEATLAPLRDAIDEIVLAVDDRVPPSWVSGYRRLADVVVLVPFPGAFSRLFGWLVRQCRGEWVLQIDADEVPSVGLASEVQRTIAEGGITHAWISRRWLHPDGGSYLAQWPWQPDYQRRLLRNDPAVLRFPGLHHDVVRVAGAWRHLHEPVYHTALVTEDLVSRQARVARYEQARPGLRADGRSINEAFYLPESRRGLAIRPVPAEDAANVAAHLANDGRPPGPRRTLGGRRPPAVVRHASYAEVTAYWEGRTVGEGAYRARLHLRDDDLTATAGVTRTFAVEVDNLGNEPWPGGEEQQPLILVGARAWSEEHGTHDVGRTRFGRTVAPGATQLVPVEVTLPAAGRWIVEIDVVHEFVRWFECAIEIEVTCD